MYFLTTNFKVFIILMKLFGLPLDSDRNIDGFSFMRWILLVYSTSSVIFNLFINLAMAKSTIEMDWGVILITLQWKMLFAEFRRSLVAGLVDSLSHKLILSIIPTIFVIHVYITRHWKNLWSNLLKIQHDMKLSNDFKSKCRRRCYFAFFLLIFVCDSNDTFSFEEN